MKTYTMYAGLWRTDGGFVSTIRVKNVLVVAPMDITPVLFMADGTPYPLPSVHLAVSGVATIDINNALANAPPSVLGHISQFGSAALIHNYPSPGHVSASVAVIDASRSLSYTFPFVEPMGHAMEQTLDGLWWKHDSGVLGWIALSNVSDTPTQASVQLVGTGNTPQPGSTIALPPHTTQMFHLEDLASNPSPLVKDAGGIRVQYTGLPGSVQVNGGLENGSEGYSANIPFWSHDMSSASAASITYASAGLMSGKPDPTMMPGFPKDTSFTPYLVLRNTTEKPLDVSLQLNYMNGTQGSAPFTRSLPVQHLGPSEARQVDMQAPLMSAGLKDFNGSINLSTTFTGKGGDLMLATGSVDQTGTYVFEVEPQGISATHSKFTNYWGVSGGNDTMFSLWNPTNAAQDIVATFYYADGSGKYTLPIHLGAQASTMIDMAMLIAQHKPDPDGNVIPSSIQEGSAQFGSAKGRSDTITLVIAGGIYNVADATCGSSCINCCGDNNFVLNPNPMDIPTGDSMQCNVGVVDCNGNPVSPSSWSSSNTAVMTVNSSGLVTAVGVGQATITANFVEVPTYTGQICSPSPTCPASDETPQATCNVTPKIRLGGSSGTDITSTTQSVVVGQQIVLFGDYTLPSGFTFTSLSWTIPGTGSTPPTAISNFAVSADSTSGGPVSLTSSQLGQQQITFYWTAPTPTNSPNTVTFTLNYTDNNNTSQSSPVTATFNVAGPSNPNVVTCGGNVPTGTCPNGQNGPLGQVVINTSNNPPTLGLGNATSSNVGIIFNASATPPSSYSNNFTWIQLITANTIAITATPSVSCVQITIPQTAGGTGVDVGGGSTYVYNSGVSSVNDNPDFPLQTSYGSQITNVTEVNDSPFNATMYLLWSSGLTNSIPVPLGSVSWQWSGDAAYNSSSQAWSLKSGSGTANAFVAASSYPSWNSKVPFTTVTCH